MADMFSDEWMKSYMEKWNADTDLTGALGAIGFSSVIAYGIEGDDAPLGVITVENGQVTAAGAFNGETLNWDIRASAAQWDKWSAKPPGMMGLGMAYTSRKIKFVVGDYTAMIKDPRMAGPFIKTFSVMAKV